MERNGWLPHHQDFILFKRISTKSDSGNFPNKQTNQLSEQQTNSEFFFYIQLILWKAMAFVGAAAVGVYAGILP